MTTSLVLPWSRPPITSNEGGRGRGRDHAKTKKAMRQAAATLAKAQKVRAHGPSDVLITWHAPNAIRRDAGSLAPLLKATIDGFVDAGVWPGDHFAWVRTESCRVVIDRANPRITLDITEVPA